MLIRLEHAISRFEETINKIQKYVAESELNMLPLYILLCTIFLPRSVPVVSTAMPYIILLTLVISLALLALKTLERRKLAVYELLVVLFMASLFLSAFLSETTLLNSFFGDGVGVILAVICASLLGPVKLTERHVNAFMRMTAFLALASLLINIGTIFNGDRLTGVVNQSNLLAILLGAGVIVGVFTKYYRKTAFSTASFLLIIATLTLTGTRAVIIPILIILSVKGLIELIILNKIQSGGKKIHYRDISIVVALVVLLLCLLAPSSGRVTAPSDLKFGFSYRYNLLEQSFKLAEIMPVWGYGANSISTVFDKYFELPADISRTYSEGYFIESSHNIFADILLQYGWLPGVFYVLIILLTSYASIKISKNKESYLPIALFLFLLLQKLLTVTFFEVDVLFWLSVCMINYQYVQQAGAYRQNKVKYIIKLPILLTLSVILVGFVVSTIVISSLKLSQRAARERIEYKFTFPLATTKEIIETGVTQDNAGVSLVSRWNHKTKTSQHAGYPGVDIFVPEGTGVVAAKAGLVLAVHDRGCDGINQFPTIYIRGEDGLIYLYSHLMPNSITIKPKTYVSVGDPIGRVGSDKCAQGAPPHLHFDVSQLFMIRSKSDTFLDENNYIDPQATLQKYYQLLN